MIVEILLGVQCGVLGVGVWKLFQPPRAPKTIEEAFEKLNHNVLVVKELLKKLPMTFPKLEKLETLVEEKGEATVWNIQELGARIKEAEKLESERTDEILFQYNEYLSKLLNILETSPISVRLNTPKERRPMVSLYRKGALYHRCEKGSPDYLEALAEDNDLEVRED